MLVKLSTFRDKISALNVECAENGGLPQSFATLGKMYRYINSLGCFGRIVVKFQIWLFARGDDRIGLFDTFNMYNDLNKKLVELEELNSHHGVNDA